MTILTGSLTSLQLSGSSLVQRKDTGAEVLMDMDFTQLPNQTLTSGQYNSIGGISAFVLTNGSPFFEIVNGQGISYSDAGTGFAYIYWYPYTTFTGSTLNINDRIRVVAEYSASMASAAPATDPDYFALGVNADNNQLISYCRGADSGNSNKFVYVAAFTVNSFAAGTSIITTTGATTSVTGAIRLELDGTQENWYFAADRSFSPGGLTTFPAPGDITPQSRVRMVTNSSQPDLITNYYAPFTSSVETAIFAGFDSNQAALLSGSLQRLTIFRYGET